MSLKDRVEAVMTKRGMKPQDLSGATGIPYLKLWRLLNGKRVLAADVAYKLAQALGVSTEYLISGNQQVSETHSGFTKAIALTDQVLVPILHPSYLANAGEGHNLHGVTMETSEHIPLSEKDLGAIGEEPIFGVRVEGTSMEPADIKDGSVAIINPNQEIRYGDPCLVCFGIDEAAIKFVYPQPGGGLRIESADASYKKHQFSREEVEGGLVRVVGPVVSTVWVGKPKRGI